MADDHDKQPNEASTEPTPPQPDGGSPALDQMKQTVEEEKKGIDELGAKIQEAKEHEKQLRTD